MDIEAPSIQYIDEAITLKILRGRFSKHSKKKKAKQKRRDTLFETDDSGIENGDSGIEITFSHDEGNDETEAAVNSAYIKDDNETETAVDSTYENEAKENENDDDEKEIKPMVETYFNSDGDNADEGEEEEKEKEEEEDNDDETFLPRHIRMHDSGTSLQSNRTYRTHLDNFLARQLGGLVRVSSSESTFSDYSVEEEEEIESEARKTSEVRRDSFMQQVEYFQKRLKQSVSRKRSPRPSSLVLEEEIVRTVDKATDMYYYMRLIKHKGKVEHAAFIDFDGKVLLQDTGMGLEPNQALSLVRMLECPLWRNGTKPQLFKIKVGQRDFVCLRNNESTIVGIAETHFINASTSKCFVTVVLTDPNSKGSCIYHLAKFIRHVNKNVT